MKVVFTSVLLLSFIFAQAQCDPFYGKVVINEFMPGNSSTVTDEYGEFDDWIELHNTTDEAINLEGYFLSDSHGNRTKYTLPNVEIAANGYLIVWCDGQPEQGELHAPYNLSNDGEEIGLYNPDSTSVDYFRYGPGSSNISWGRFPNGTGPIQQLIPTFNSANVNSVTPGLVINEFMAINGSTATDQYGGFEDWIEIYNNSSQPINLEGYFLSDQIGEPTKFVFPDTTIAPDDYIIVWCDQGLFEPGLHTFFKLGGDGDDILFSDADTLTVDYLRYGIQTIDVSEGRYPNGIGSFSCPEPTFEASNDGNTGIFDRRALDILTLWPNPTRGTLSIENAENINIETQLFNAVGARVNDYVLTPGVNKIDLSTVPAGIYFLKTEFGYNKVIVQN